MLDPDNNTSNTAADQVTENGPGEASAAPAAKKASRSRATSAKNTEAGPAAEKPAKKAASRKKAAAVDTVDDNSADTSGETAAASAVTMPVFEAPKVTVTRRRRTTRSVSPAADAAAQSETPAEGAAEDGSAEQAPAKQKAAKKAAAKTAVKAEDASTDEPAAKGGKKAAKKTAKKSSEAETEDAAGSDATAESGETEAAPAKKKAAAKKKSGKSKKEADASEDGQESREEAEAGETDEAGQSSEAGETGEASETEGGGRRRPRRRGGRRRRRSGEDDAADSGESEGGSAAADAADSTESEYGEQGEGGGTRRRRRRRRGGSGGGSAEAEDKPRNPEDEITALSGSTRLEAKKQRRREGREAGRRRAPIVSEAEFLARRESVERVMVIRQRDELTQIGVLEDNVLVEHYVARESQTSLIGNVYLGRVQNVLPSMEAAFIDIGKGRNAVLYAGEVNWQALGHQDGQPRKIESVLKSGQPVLVQVTKDPIGHKGARLTSQISLPGRFLVFVPDGTTSGISRKLPDTERNRLKSILKEIVPDSAGVIVRTAAEGASEEELTHDVERLTARWNDIEKKVAAGQAPQLLYGEPDLTLKVVRDLFTEDFVKLVIQGDGAWDLVDDYVAHVAPDLRERLQRHDAEAEDENGRAAGDVFAAYRIDEQIAKGLDRKVWLPSGGSLIIDRTEAMTVVDVNTGKFTGSGGNLEETVTKNNLEAAEEIVRQLRLRDIGGIIVVDFIDMVLESNRDLVLRRLVECLGRDRTRHQVAEVTSLGLVQMTRKRIGTGLLEAFSSDCEHCKGRGVVVHEMPVEPSNRDDSSARGGSRSRRSGRGRTQNGPTPTPTPAVPSPKDVASMARPESAKGAGEGEQPSAEAEIIEAEITESDLVTPQDVVAEPAAVEDAPAIEAPEGQAEQTEPVEQATEQDSEQEAEAAPVETGARTRTSTRRRSARRPAGPPPAEPDDSDAAEPVEPAELPAQADLGESGSDDDLAADGSEPITDETAEGGSFLFHVPVKRKGSRKR